MTLLLDPSRRSQHWLVQLNELAAAAYDPARVAELRPALERLSHALAYVAAAGTSLDLRARDAAGAEPPARGQA
jgi:hypothetical protein